MPETRDDLREALDPAKVRRSIIAAIPPNVWLRGRIASAIMRSVVAPILAQVSALQAEVEEARQDAREAGHNGGHLLHQFDQAKVEIRRLSAEVEHLQKVEGERGRLERALGTSLAFLDMAAGEGLGFVETEDGSPAMEASDICGIIAETIGADIDGPIWTALRDAGRKSVADPQAPSDNPLTETKEGSEHV